jgi:hypothetical protein
MILSFTDPPFLHLRPSRLVLSIKRNVSSNSESIYFPIVDASEIEDPDSQLAIARKVTEACIPSTLTSLSDVLGQLQH